MVVAGADGVDDISLVGGGVGGGEASKRRVVVDVWDCAGARAGGYAFYLQCNIFYHGEYGVKFWNREDVVVLVSVYLFQKLVNDSDASVAYVWVKGGEGGGAEKGD